MSGARVPAELLRRVIAYVIDGAIGGALVGAIGGILIGIAISTQGGFPVIAAVLITNLLALMWFGVYSVMQGGDGSIGMRIMSLRLAVLADDQPLGFGRALGRNLIWGFGSAIIVGVFSPLFDRSPWHRGWHDLATGAVMTDIRVGHEPVPFATVPPIASASPPPPPVHALPEDLEHTVISERSAPTAEHALPSDVEATMLGSGHPAPASSPVAPAPVQPQVAPTPAEGVIAFVPGITGPPPRRPAAPTPETMGPDEVPVDETRLTQGGPKAIAAVVWDDGSRQALYGRTIFGRNPSSEAGANVVAVRDETLSLSKTHFEIGSDDDGLFVIDRHSTNGVLLRRGDDRRKAAPGERTSVRAGDILEFGDRHVTLEVAR